MGSRKGRSILSVFFGAALCSDWATKRRFETYFGWKEWVSNHEGRVFSGNYKKWNDRKKI